MNKKTETDTNFGWWTDKPEREGRPSSWATSWQPVPEPPQGRSVWIKSALVVAVFFAFILALIFAARA
ncbi:MAG: hypothetical protein KJ901_19075 [Gammaproteobacteria bacterium]|nr:hypothetical protein [Gammaproteobacteria bacterium]MBU1440474.1 hypothetical protein [Gammaproteobacteria bacterium]